MALIRTAKRYSKHCRTFTRQVRAQHEIFGADVKRLTGKGRLSQFAEICRLSAGPGKLWPEDYYRYRLYDDAKYAWPEKFQFMSNWAIPQRLNGNDWAVVADDKLVFGALAAHLGFRVPTVHAIYHPMRSYGDIPAMRDTAALRRYMRNGLPLPAFVKPIDGYLSEAVFIVDGKDAQTGEMRLRDANGAPASEQQMYQVLDGGAYGGWMFQEIVKPHRAMKEVCGDRLGTVRFMTVVDQGKATLRCVVWKITSGANLADNSARLGNLMAPVDIETGVVGQPMTGIGPKFREVTTHPDTGKTLLGFQLPYWREAKSACLSLARSLPAIPLQGWDIAITDEGPVLLEINRRPSLVLPQLVQQRGFAHGFFKDYLRRQGVL